MLTRPAAETEEANDRVRRRSASRFRLPAPHMTMTAHRYTIIVTQPTFELFDDLWQEQQHADALGDDTEIVQREPENLGMPERFPGLILRLASTRRRSVSRSAKCALHH